jgi:hypothetical protein
MKVIIDGIEYMPIPDKQKGKNLSSALSIRLERSDAGDNISIRDYLRFQLEKLWEEKEEFSGKRPFGNSGWECDLQKPLIKHGFLKGELDELGDLLEYDDEETTEYIIMLIKEAFKET